MRRLPLLWLLCLALALGLACPASAGVWTTYSRNVSASSMPPFASRLGLEPVLASNPALFARMMERTALSPEALAGQTPEVQALLIQQAVGNYAERLVKQTDLDISASDGGRFKADEDPFNAQALGDLRQLLGLVPERLRYDVAAAQDRAQEHYLRKVKAKVEAAEREWQKGEEPPEVLSSQGRSAPWSELAALRRPGDAIGKDPGFQRWLKTTDDPNAPFAAKLAQNLTWAQADLLEKSGGISKFAVKQGCEHCCLGCVVKAGERRPIRQMSWEDFTSSVRALVGLQAALQALHGRPFTLIHKEGVEPFFDSEPMSIRFPTKDGPPKTVVGMVKFLHETAGVTSVIWSGGWNPKSAYAEDAAREMVADILAGKAPYLAIPKDDKNLPAFGVQIKPVVKRFRDEARAFILPLLAADGGFQRKFGKEFKKFGFDFKRYPRRKAEAAFEAYSLIVDINMTGFFRSSSYLRDRLENLKTLAPVLGLFDKTVFLNSYFAELARPGHEDFFDAENDAEMYFLAPWASKPAAFMLKGYMHERMAVETGSNIPDAKWVVGPWRYLDKMQFEISADLGTPMALFNGTIGFSGTRSYYGFVPTLPNLAVAEEFAASSLLDNPVLALGSARPLWAAAGDRLDGTRHLDITEAVRRSVAARVMEVSRGKVAPRLADVGGMAVLVSLNGKRREGFVEVRAGGSEYLFRFADGFLYTASQPPQLVFSR